MEIKRVKVLPSFTALDHSLEYADETTTSPTIETTMLQLGFQ